MVVNAIICKKSKGDLQGELVKALLCSYILSVWNVQIVCYSPHITVFHAIKYFTTTVQKFWAM